MDTNPEPVGPQAPQEPPSPAPQPARSNSKWIMIAAVAIAVALFAAPMLLERRSASGSGGAAPAVARAGASCSPSQGPAKLDFTVKDMHGATVNLADYKGKVILLNFWATWCGPCKLEIPEFVELYDQYKDKGFVILGMLTDDTPSPGELRAFVSGYKMNYPILYSQDDIADAFGPIYGIPTSFVIGRDGSICEKHMGPATKEEFERTLKSLL